MSYITAYLLLTSENPTLTEASWRCSSATARRTTARTTRCSSRPARTRNRTASSAPSRLPDSSPRGFEAWSTSRASRQNNLDAERETGRRGRAVDPERNLPGGLGVDVGPEETVPDGQAGPQICSVVLRVPAVMDMVVAWRHEDPLQPSRAPRHVHVHPIILEEALREDQHEEPGGRVMQQGRAECERQVEQDLVRHRGANAGQPVHVRR